MHPLAVTRLWVIAERPFYPIAGLDWKNSTTFVPQFSVDSKYPVIPVSPFVLDTVNRSHKSCFAGSRFVKLEFCHVSCPFQDLIDRRINGAGDVYGNILSTLPKVNQQFHCTDGRTGGRRIDWLGVAACHPKNDRQQPKG